VHDKHREFQVKEYCMAEHQPRKAGEYERPMTGTSSSLALIIGGIALLIVIIAALLFLR
jgi:LPXTG-motif cell wall-anchored protein